MQAGRNPHGTKLQKYEEKCGKARPEKHIGQFPKSRHFQEYNSRNHAKIWNMYVFGLNAAMFLG